MDNIFRFNKLAGDSDNQAVISAELVSALQRTLMKRTFARKMINDTPFTDECADHRGRECFRAALVSIDEGNISDAFWWYMEGHLEFTVKNSTCVIYKDEELSDVDYNCIALRSKHTYTDDSGREYYEWEITARCFVTSAWGTQEDHVVIGHAVTKQEQPMSLWTANKKFNEIIDECKRISHEAFPHYNEADQNGLDFTYDEEETK
jgi:hypothetical protein